MRAATTLLCGAVLLRIASAATGEIGRVEVRAISARAIFGLGYLIVFGSVVAFSAYVWLLERRSATLVATHTFVNPVVAVLLGWLAAGELLTPRIIGATGLILAAVFLLKSDTLRGSVARPQSPDLATRHTLPVVRPGDGPSTPARGTTWAASRYSEPFAITLCDDSAAKTNAHRIGHPRGSGGTPISSVDAAAKRHAHTLEGFRVLVTQRGTRRRINGGMTPLVRRQAGLLLGVTRRCR